MFKMLLSLIKIIVLLYAVICSLLYFFQEKIIFIPEKLDRQHRFAFQQPFEERFITMQDGVALHGLHFKTDSAKGLIFYLHGNAGSLDGWGHVAKTYTDNHYDVFIFDYRGFGKSEGKIKGSEQVFQDNQQLYDTLKKQYPENQMIVLGYSIGSGMAARLAATNHPKKLILQAPYYNLPDMLKKLIPFVPSWILKYRFMTNEYLKEYAQPITIFHGDQDEVIPYESSLQLQAEFKPKDSLITLKNQGHNGITENPEYQLAIKALLGQ
jgi:uncharacterized protein